MHIHARRTLQLCVLTVLTVLLASCGSSSSKSPGDSDDNNSDSTDTTSDTGDQDGTKRDAGKAPSKTSDARVAQGNVPSDAATDTPASNDDAGDDTPPSMPSGGKANCLQAGSGKYTEPGPYAVSMMDVDLGTVEASQGTGKYTIFFPTQLETDCLHPIVAWGNGTGVTGSSVYAFFNSNAASWGMVVAAAQDSNTGSGAFHKAGIDWLLKQNQDSSSPFFGKLSTRAGVGGHSQGGFGATMGSQHPNVQALVSVAGGGVPKAGVATLCLTGTMDQLESSATQEFMATPGPAFLGDWMNGDHVTTETLGGYIQKDPGSLQMQRLYAAWFRCFLSDDDTACALFKGAPTSCGICQDSGWAKLAARNL